LNGEAAALLLSNPKAYAARVQEFVKKYASVEFNLDTDDDDSSLTCSSSSSTTTTPSTTPPTETSSPSSARSTTRISTDSESSDDNIEGMTSSATSSSIAIKTKRAKDMIDDDFNGIGERKEEEEQLSDMDDDTLDGGRMGDTEIGGEIGTFAFDQVNTDGDLTEQMEF